MSVEVDTVNEVTGELVEAARRLLPQLSRSAAPLSADDLTQITSHQAITLLIARSEGVIVGMLTLVIFPLPTGLRARIEDVVVDQDARGQGVGTALTMAALKLAEQHSARSVDLTSRASRVAANRLYQQLGFRLRDSNVYRYQSQPPAPWRCLDHGKLPRHWSVLGPHGIGTRWSPGGHQWAPPGYGSRRSHGIYRYHLERRSSPGTGSRLWPSPSGWMAGAYR
jgi:ribosomal protein S18 acetylase RimI-like enzyme